MDQTTNTQNSESEVNNTSASRRQSDAQTPSVQNTLSVNQDLSFYQQWLEQQCDLIPACDTAVLLVPLADDQRFQPVALVICL